MRLLLLFVGALSLTSCLLPEVHIVNKPPPKQSVDPNNQAAQLLSCAGVQRYNETPPGPKEISISGIQDPGKYGRGQVVVRFTVTPDGTVDPTTVEVPESGVNIGPGMSTLSPTREMILEAKSVARTCRYKPAMRDGAGAAEQVVTSFILTRNT